MASKIGQFSSRGVFLCFGMWGIMLSCAVIRSGGHIVDKIHFFVCLVNALRSRLIDRFVGHFEQRIGTMRIVVSTVDRVTSFDLANASKFDLVHAVALFHQLEQLLQFLFGRPISRIKVSTLRFPFDSFIFAVAQFLIDRIAEDVNALSRVVAQVVVDHDQSPEYE